MRWIAVLLCAVSAALVGAELSSAQRVEHFRGIGFNFSFVDQFLSDECGFEVTQTFTATADVTLFYDTSGNIVREHDIFPAGLVTFSASGKSFSYPLTNSVFTDYPEGVFIGAPAIVESHGLLDKVPGIPAEAGVLVFRGTVVDITPEGIPITSNDELIESRGNLVTLEAFVGAVCGALSDP